MGIISLEQTDRLYWLGRYSERVYTTIRLYFQSYDQLIDNIGETYSSFCSMLEIPNIYQNKADFIKRYPFDKTDTNSIYSNLLRAYDNAIVLREEIGSETLSYIQLALYDMSKASNSEAPLMELQSVVDNLLAFWGIADDWIDSEVTRNIIKAGKRLERLDLYARLKLERKEMIRELHRLKPRLERSGIPYSRERFALLEDLVLEQDLDYRRIVYEVEQLLEE